MNVVGSNLYEVKGFFLYHRWSLSSLCLRALTPSGVFELFVFIDSLFRHLLKTIRGTTSYVKVLLTFNYLAVSDDHPLSICPSGTRPGSLGGRGVESHRGQKNDLCGVLQMPLLQLQHSVGFVGFFLYHLNFHSLTAPYHSLQSLIHLIFIVIMIQDLRTSLIRNRTLKITLN